MSVKPVCGTVALREMTNVQVTLLPPPVMPLPHTPLPTATQVRELGQALLCPFDGWRN